MICNSIWADTYYIYSGQELEYYITMVSGNTEVTIFNGKAYRRPDENSIKINMSRIVETYMRSYIPFKSLVSDGQGRWTYYDHEAVKTFNIYRASNGSLLASFRFLNDWSYDSSVAYNGLDANLTYGEMYETDLNSVYHPLWYIQGRSTIMTHDGEPCVRTIFDRGEGTPNDACGRGMTIIFQNRRGGWSCFYPEGKIEKTDAMTSFNTVQAYNNSNIPERGTIKHFNEVTRTWTVHTGWLTDSQAENIARNLLLSPNVYISLDQEIKNVIPVVITNGEAPHKSYDTEKGVVDYEITFEESQKQTRR